jgi:hypothetical protein
MNIEDLEKHFAIAIEQLNDAIRGVGTEDFEIVRDRFRSLERELALAKIALAKSQEYAIPFRPQAVYDNGDAVPLEIVWRPEAAVSGPFLIQTDYNCFLTFNAVWRDTKNDNDLFEGGFKALIEIENCQITKFGSPNDEGLYQHPLSIKGLEEYDIFKVENSVWIEELTSPLFSAFKNDPKFSAFVSESEEQHFIFTFHDSTFECIARGLKATLSEKPIEEIIEPLIRRIMDE